jgi:hypothetical protein
MGNLILRASCQTVRDQSLNRRHQGPLNSGYTLRGKVHEVACLLAFRSFVAPWALMLEMGES